MDPGRGICFCAPKVWNICLAVALISPVTLGRARLHDSDGYTLDCLPMGPLYGSQTFSFPKGFE